MSNYFGSIDLTKLGNIVRQHPDAVRKVQMRDGTTHMFLTMEFNEKREQDQYGNTHYLKSAIKKAQQKEGVNYYIGDFKPSQWDGQQVQQQPQGVQPQPTNDDQLPF